jgi:hypothetical protein
MRVPLLRRRHLSVARRSTRSPHERSPRFNDRKLRCGQEQI